MSNETTFVDMFDVADALQRTIETNWLAITPGVKSGLKHGDNRMPWGFRFPSSFGQFGPDGEFVGWDDTLAVHFETKLTEAERKEHENWVVNYRSSVSGKFRKDLGSIEPHEWPSEYRLNRPPKKVGAVMSVTNRLLIVADPFKTIVEELEPGLHQFSPIRLTLKNGQPVPGAYHVMVIGQYLDSLDPDASDEGSLSKRSSQFYAYLSEKKYYAGISLSDHKIKDKHLWYETRLGDPEIFLSDTLHTRLKASDLLLPKTHQLKDNSAAKPKKNPTTLALWGTQEWVDFHYQTAGAIVPKSVSDGSVWAVFEPAGITPGFFPVGTFLGWEEGLIKHSRKNRLASLFGQSNPIGSMVGEVAQKLNQHLGPLQPHEQPKVFFTQNDGMERYPSLIRLNGQAAKNELGNLQYARPLVVDAQLKGIIETLEPGAHHFWPLQILMSNDKTEYPHPMFGIIIGHHLDAFRPDQSRPNAFREAKARYFAKSDSQNIVSGLAMSSEEIGAIHLWRENSLASPGVFMSSRLMSEIQKNRLLMPKTFKMKLM